MNILFIPQVGETPVQTTHGTKFTVRHAYARSAETQRANDCGQDFLAYASDQSSISFVLCDGVSLSYFGELAARFLGTELLQWISSPQLDGVLNQDKLQSALHSQLTILAEKGRRLVDEHHMPPAIPGIWREVLEEKKAKWGSETTFVCGRMDLPSDRYPEGRLWAAWMGDSRFRLWSDTEERSILLGDYMKTSQRWSTRSGLIGGEPGVLLLTNAASEAGFGIRRLCVYSDGLSELDQYIVPPADEILQELVNKARGVPASDDISFLDISWGEPHC